MGWIGWSLVALVGWGVWAVLNKLALRTLDWRHVLVAYWLAYTAALGVLLAARVDPRPLASRDGLFALAGALTGVIAVAAFSLALRSGSVATVAPLSSLYPALAAILALVFLHETPLARAVGGNRPGGAGRDPADARLSPPRPRNRGVRPGVPLE
jgi:uncharacterized membrane protein